MAGNINKFMNAGLFDATALAKTAADIEHGYDLAEINRDFGLGVSALGTYEETQRMKAQRELEKYVKDQQEAANRSTSIMDSIGQVVGGVGSLANMGSQGFNYNQTEFGAGFGAVDGIGTFGPNYGIPQKIGAGGGYVEGFGGTFGPNWGIK